MTTKIDARQSRQRAQLDQLSLNSDVKLDILLNLVNSELTPPLRLRQANPSTLSLNIDPVAVTTSSGTEGHLRTKTIQPINGVLPTFTGGSITFPGTSGGSITATGVTLFTAYTLTIPASNWIKVLIQVNSAGQILLSTGTVASTEAIASLPVAAPNTLAIGYVSMQNVAGTIQNVTGSRIYQFQGTSVVSSTLTPAELAIQRGTDVTTAGIIAALSVAGNSFLRLTAATTLSGIVAPVAPVTSGKILILTNANTSPIQVNDQDASAAAGNRIITGTSAPISLASGASLYIVYDDSSTRWRVVGGTGSGASTKYISQTAHGFTVGQWVGLSGSVFAIATRTGGIFAAGVVSLVIDANSFILTTSGYLTGLSGLTAGGRYFINTAGAVSTTETVTVTSFSQTALYADSTISGYVTIGSAIYGADNSIAGGLINPFSQLFGGIKTFLVKISAIFGVETNNTFNGFNGTETVGSGNSRLMGRLDLGSSATLVVNGDLMIIGALTGTTTVAGTGTITNV